jgi:hypothetical protein
MIITLEQRARLPPSCHRALDAAERIVGDIAALRPVDLLSVSKSLVHGDSVGLTWTSYARGPVTLRVHCVSLTATLNGPLGLFTFPYDRREAALLCLIDQCMSAIAVH